MTCLPTASFNLDWSDSSSLSLLLLFADESVMIVYRGSIISFAMLLLFSDEDGDDDEVDEDSEEAEIDMDDRLSFE